MYEQQKVISYLTTLQIEFKLLFRRQVLEDMEMLSAFTAILHLPNLSKADHLLAVLKASDVFSAHELKKIGQQVQGKRYIVFIVCYS